MRVFIKNCGCSTNLADGQVLAGCLAQAGYKLADSASKANVIIYNTCAVKGPTENRAISALKTAPPGKKIVVAGCLPIINFDRLSREVHFDGAVGPAAGEKIADVITRVLAGEKVVELENALRVKPELRLPKLTSNLVVSVVPVSYGCLGSCAYCCVVFARGSLRSYATKEVAERIRKDLAAGAKEFWITSQDTAAYGRDVDTNLAELLEVICAVKGDFKIRVGMMTPNLVSAMQDDLIQTFKNEKVFKFVHLPVQSGDDTVLQLMRRFYKVQDFKKIVDVFRNAFPQVTLATDIICGFPGETKEAFANTLKLISEVKPDIVNVSKFFARPGTAAAKMHNAVVKPQEIKRRSTEAAKLVKQISLDKNERWIGWEGEVLVDEKGKTPKSWIGRNFAYKPITLKTSEDLLGKTSRVKIEKAFSTHLNGALV